MFLTITKIPNLWKIYLKKLTILAITITFAVLAWANLFLNFNINANAATIQDLNLAVTVEGISDQIEGKAQEDIGTIKNKLDNAADNVEDTSEGLIDTVKDFFN